MPSSHGKRNTAARDSSDTTPQPISRIAYSEKTPDLQFVNTTSTTVIDEPSRRLIRKHVLRQRPKPTGSDASANAVATTGQVHRFRLGPQSLKQTLNQPRQISQNFTILSFHSDEQSSIGSTAPIFLASPFPAPAVSKSRHAKFNREEDKDELFAESNLRTAPSQLSNIPIQEESSELGWVTEQEKIWLKSFIISKGVSQYNPSQGAIDPFNAMALTISYREQVLINYYFTDSRQLLSLLIPCCQAWFSLAIEDKAAFHAVLSHYSVTHRIRFQNESPTESIHHLSASIQTITKRFQDQRQSCSNGTIGAVAGLIIYESANGALPNIDLHMRGLQEMVRRRGGFERADFPMDLKRLIAWTDLNTANDLWQPPLFPALQLSASTAPAQEAGFSTQQSSQSEPERPKSTLSTSLEIPSELDINVVVEDLKSFAREVKVITRSLSPLNRPRIEISDRIYTIERRIVDIIHSPPVPQNLLSHACAIAALIYMRSNVRDSVCNFRIVDTSKLKVALQSLVDLSDMRAWGMEIRSRENLVWTVGFGAVSSSGRPERPWFVRMFRHLCDMLKLQTWENVKNVFENVLWKDELDSNGIRLWEEAQMIENI